MHEMPVTESILDIVLKHAVMNECTKVLSIHLQIGGLSDLADEWLQRYFNYLSRGTMAEGAKLKIDRMPVVLKCDDCRVSSVTQPAQIDTFVCPVCGAKSAALVSGREYYIKTMEAQ